MYEHRERTRFSDVWKFVHVLSLGLAVIKLLGFVPDLQWWIVMAPFIFDALIVILLIFGIGIMYLLSIMYD